VVTSKIFLFKAGDYYIIVDVANVQDIDSFKPGD